ncbi:CD180 antigen [Rhinophrynus dorsalis]
MNQHLVPFKYQVIPYQSYSCEGLKLQDVPESIPSTTEVLDFSFNSLFALYETTFSRLGNLEYLDLTRCHIKWIYEDVFKNNTQLTTIILIGNDILYISKNAFSGPVSLRHLFLDQTSLIDISIIPMDNLDSLETLSLGNNFISSMWLPSNLPTRNLKTLDLRSNYITRIYTKDVEVLKEVSNLSLILKVNNIEYIEPNSFNTSKLYIMDLSGNSKELSAVLNGLNGLTTNILAIGIFGDIDTNSNIQPDTLLGLCNVSVKEIRIQYSLFYELSNVTFSCLTNVHKLDLTHTNLDFLPEFNSDNFLTELVIGQNKFQYICDINPNSFPFLTHLHVQRNIEMLNLGDGCLKNLSRLEYLDLSNSNIRTDTCCKTQFTGLFNLRYLNLSNNFELTLTNLAFPNNDYLEVLDISYIHNSFDGSLGPFNNLKLLRVLNMSNSNINASNERILEGLQNLNYLSMKKSFFPSGIIRNNNLFQQTLNLEVLILSFCELTAIEEHTFYKLKKLRFVDLSHNKLTVFTSNAFGNLRNVHLNFAFNLISTIPLYLVHNISGKRTINLSYNPLDCSCSNIELISWYKEHLDTFGLMRWKNGSLLFASLKILEEEELQFEDFKTKGLQESQDKNLSRDYALQILLQWKNPQQLGHHSL